MGHTIAGGTGSQGSLGGVTVTDSSMKSVSPPLIAVSRSVKLYWSKGNIVREYELEFETTEKLPPLIEISP